MKTVSLLIGCSALAVVVVLSAIADGENISSRPTLAVNYETISVAQRSDISVSAVATPPLFEAPRLFDVYQRSEYYFHPLYQTKLPCGINPWMGYQAGYCGAFSHGGCGNCNGCNCDDPLGFLVNFPFNLSCGHRSGSCGTARHGGCDYEGCDCNGGCAQSSRPQPHAEQSELRTHMRQPEQSTRPRSVIAPTTPVDIDVNDGVVRQPTEVEGSRPNNANDTTPIEVPNNYVPEDLSPAEPRKLTPTRVREQPGSDFQIREARPIDEPATVVPPANTLPQNDLPEVPRNDLPDDSATWLVPSPPKTGVTIRVARPQKTNTDTASTTTVRKVQTVALDQPTQRLTMPVGNRLQFRVYR